MESPHDTNRLWYFTGDPIYIISKSKILIKYNAKEFDCWNLIRIDSVILMSNALFWLEIIIYKVLPAFRESPLQLLRKLYNWSMRNK